jgi:hypothetical protein
MNEPQPIEVPGSADCIVLEIKLPVSIKDLVAIVDALNQIHSNTLLMRYFGPMLQLYEPRQTTKTNL